MEREAKQRFRQYQAYQLEQAKYVIKMAREEQLRRVKDARTQMQTTMMDNGRLHKQWRREATEERRSI
jgi:hypothetical protein